MTIGRPSGRHLVALLALMVGWGLGGCVETDSVAGPEDEPEPTRRHRVVPLAGPSSSSTAEDLSDTGWVVGSIGGRASVWVVDTAGGVSSVEVLDPEGSADSSSALAVNNSGQVVGWRRNGAVLPFVWTRASGMVGLPLPPGLSSGIAFGLNDSGQIVGGGATGPEFDPAAGGRVLVWTVDAAGAPIDLTDLGTFGGDGAVGRAINEHGDIAGDLWRGAEVASFLRKGEELEHLPPQTQALAVNAEGKVAGSWSDQAALWASGSMQAIGPLGSVASDLNDADEIVGEVFGPVETGQGLGFIRTADAIQFLEGLSTIDGTRARGVNAAGFIVGESYVPTAGASEAVMWIPNRNP